MKNVRILDCTLRDGGRIINCEFSDKEIRDITSRLSNAKIDIIEVGFIRDRKKVNYTGGSTFFTDMKQISPFLDRTRKNIMYVAFIDYGMYDFNVLKMKDKGSVDGIRLGFTKKDYTNSRNDIIQCAKRIMACGYKLFIQGVNTLNYSDLELLEMLNMINEIHPYCFGIVDTYGAMYIDDIDRIYGLVGHNLNDDICIDFHSHNNYQLSFALAQEVIKLSNGTRQIIIDGTLNGMGKAAGNLNTELIVDYLVRKMNYNYEFDEILDIIDDNIYKYAQKHKWGYSIPAMMSGIYKAHPNNVIYLTEKYRLNTKDIKNLVSMIDPEVRQRYDYDNIEKIYIQYIAEKIDDTHALQCLRQKMGDKEVLVLVPGNTLTTQRTKIKNYISLKKPVIISVNYISEYAEVLAFFGNLKRYTNLTEERKGKTVIITSNIHSDTSSDVVINYYSVINRGYRYFENSTMMLINLLKRIGVKEITLAGFDGFEPKNESNYIDDSFQNDRHVDDYNLINSETMKMLSDISKTLEGNCLINFLTPSKFEAAIRKVN
ncbi:MAG: aldolase catalytic domain-containing protein [Butyrivibrio sp.]|jgi:4-hydroxy 2-oxovalerate aldolase|nr:aldolase catalytic domain-containing protein [Butyrivibrio sp.]